MCINAIGMNKSVPDHLVKAEVGACPTMGFFITRIFLCWQHVLASFGKNNLVNASILMDRNDKTSYYSRVKALLPCFDMRIGTYRVLPYEMKRYSDEMRNKSNNLLSIQYFSGMKTTCKIEICHKKKISIWKVFVLKSSATAKKITAIRISGHCLPIEYLRKMGIERDKRYCNSCDEMGLVLNNMSW